jgi:hypothetical protein
MELLDLQGHKALTLRELRQWHRLQNANAMNSTPKFGISYTISDVIAYHDVMS